VVYKILWSDGGNSQPKSKVGSKLVSKSNESESSGDVAIDLESTSESESDTSENEKV